MKDTTMILIAGVLGLGGYLAYKSTQEAVKPVSDAVNTVTTLAKDVADTAKTVIWDTPKTVVSASYNAGLNFGTAMQVTATTTQAYYETPNIQYESTSPANLQMGYGGTWVLPSGEKLGLPLGVTPKQFCMDSPSSPVCAQILTKNSQSPLEGVYNLWGNLPW